MVTTVAQTANTRVTRWAAGSPLWLQAGAVYLVIRFVSWVLLHEAAHDQAPFPSSADLHSAPGITGPDATHVDLALSWDAQWYERIAEGGYPGTLPVDADGATVQNPWAFYPVFPYTARAVMSLTGAGFPTVAPVLALLAGLGAAVLMAQLLRETVPTRSAVSALGAVAVWAAFPSSPVLQMAYTESFAMLLLVAFLLLVVRRQWWGAGGCALVLGLTRPIALPLSVVIVVAAWMRYRRRGRVLASGGHERLPALSRSEGTALGFAVVATGLSGVLWTVVSWAGTGRRDAYPSTMTAWRGESSIDVLEPWRRTIHDAWGYRDHVVAALHDDVARAIVLPALAIVLALGLSLLVLVPRVAPGVDLRLRVWCAAYSVYLLAVVDGGTSIIRYLVPLFPLAVVLVGAHRGRGGQWVSRRVELRTAFWVVVGVVGQLGWIWWLVVFTPPSDFPP